MAGAVSAGAYTAGVMDYMLETLHLWQEAKEKNKKLGTEHPDYDFSIPMHEVEIDVISGSSAGGITGSLVLLNAVDKEHTFVNRDNHFGKNNRFYQSWVEMADDEEGGTLDKLLETGDIEPDKKPESLLNTRAIDLIADKVMQIKDMKPYPPYISKSLDLVLTTTNLRGINFKIDFHGNDNSSTIITHHGGFFRYKLTNDEYVPGIPVGEDSLYFVLDLYNPRDVKYLKDATLSTAAFPIGLKSREISISQEYVRRYPKYLFGKKKGITAIIEEDANYLFNSIDGGLINNEPFGIGVKILKEKNKTDVKADRYAVIMIDPFPNQDHSTDKKNPGRDIFSIGKGMFKALRNQVLFSQDGVLDALELSDRTKFLVAPVRKIMFGGEYVRAKSDLASAPLSGFAGFLDKSFRHHDYHLGRQNCQSFLRYYFAVTDETIADRLNSIPHSKAKERFSFSEPKKTVGGAMFFPIIPDVRMLNAFENIVDTEGHGTDAKLEYPEYPSFDMKVFEKNYKTKIKRRAEVITNRLVNNFWFGIVNRLIIRRKAYESIQEVIQSELNDADLLK